MPLFKLVSILLGFVAQGLLYSWPITLTLLGILASELPHAPKCWKKDYCLALVPLAISMFMILWVVLAVLIPPLRMLVHPLGLAAGQLAMAAEIGTAAFAWYQLKEHRCFFLSLMLVELWIGYWATSIAGMILVFLAHRPV